MYSTHAPFGTAAVSDTWSSIRKCGQTGDVERLRKMRHLEPGRDAADPRAIDLDDRAGAALEILAEMRGVIERFADRDRHRRLARRARRGRPDPPPAAAPRTSASIRSRYACARRHASATVNAWLASTIISNASPTASRTADSRATSSAIDGLPTLILAPRKPCAFAADASSSTSCCAGWCSHPPSVV